MFVQIKCSFCGQPFDFDSSSGILLADCPHCGKQNTVSAPSGAGKDMTIQHDAPSLAGGKTCPSCKTTVERAAVLCIHCGYNFTTGKKVGGDNWLAANLRLVVLVGGGLVLMAVAAVYLLLPEPASPPPVVTAAVESVTVQPTLPLPTEPAASVQPGPANPGVAATATNVPSEPVQPPPPPGPTPEELAAQQAEAERIAREAQAAAERAEFAAKKIQAEQNLRQQLDTREPLHKLGETVELRRKNGVLHKGTLQRFSGTGADRAAIVATPLGEIEVLLVSLDNGSRRRMDSEYREAFIQHWLSLKLPDAPASELPEN